MHSGFADWTQLFGDPTLTAALLDRLTHNAYILNCNWDSYRLQESLKRKRKPLIEVDGIINLSG